MPMAGPAPRFGAGQRLGQLLAAEGLAARPVGVCVDLKPIHNDAHGGLHWRVGLKRNGLHAGLVGRRLLSQPGRLIALDRSAIIAT